MDLSVELVFAVALGMLALSGPWVLSSLVFRMLVDDGVPLNHEQFCDTRRRRFLIFWFWTLLPGLFGILVGGTASMPDKLFAGTLSCAGILIIGLSWLVVVLILRRKLWATWPDFTKAFPHHFFYLFHLLFPTWMVLFFWGVWLSWRGWAPS